MTKTAGILVIGNEILSGKTADENSIFLARELRELGVDVRKIAVVADDVETIASEVRLFSKTHDYVFTTGGVGPTHDDLTMEGVAAAFGRRIQRNPDLEAALRGSAARLDRCADGDAVSGNGVEDGHRSSSFGRHADDAAHGKNCPA